MSTTARKERPILFRPELVRKILDGKKTQTRRPLGLLSFGAPSVIAPHELDDGRFGFFDDADVTYVCKFGRPGDVLWVREMWQTVNSEAGPGIAYKADSSFMQPVYDGPDYGAGPSYNYDKYPGDYVMWYTDLVGGAPRSEGYHWRPSIHMPRWACRLFLEITDVRVERVQDISEADAVAEGMEPFESCPGTPEPKAAFAQAWDATYPGSWERNDWVWVISFRRTDA